MNEQNQWRQMEDVIKAIKGVESAIQEWTTELREHNTQMESLNLSIAALARAAQGI
jgi:hypothetical protein